MKEVMTVLLASATTWLWQSGHPLTLRLLCDPCRVELGSPVRIRVALENSGETAYYVQIGPDVGKEALAVTASQGACKYELESQHFDVSPDDARFNLVALRSGAKLEMRVRPMNDPASWGQAAIPIPGPGVFRVAASFTSKGRSVVGDLFPVWRGVVHSETCP
jgi:hypothetical protein